MRVLSVVGTWSKHWCFQQVFVLFKPRFSIAMEWLKALTPVIRCLIRVFLLEWLDQFFKLSLLQFGLWFFYATLFYLIKLIDLFGFIGKNSDSWFLCQKDFIWFPLLYIGDNGFHQILIFALAKKIFQIHSKLVLPRPGLVRLIFFYKLQLSRLSSTEGIVCFSLFRQLQVLSILTGSRLISWFFELFLVIREAITGLLFFRWGLGSH